MKPKTLVLSLLLAAFPLNSFSQGQSGAGGGNDVDSKSIAQYLHRFAEMAGAQELNSIISLAKKAVPEFGIKMEAARNRLKFYLIDMKNPALPPSITGLYFDTEQTAIHNRNFEVFTDQKLYSKKNLQSKIYFLTQELIEEVMIHQSPSMDGQMMHASARALSKQLLSPQPLDEKGLQQNLIDEQVGYFSTQTQIQAAKQAEINSPISISDTSNVIILKNGIQLDPSVTAKFKVGDKIKITIHATDPQGAEIRYDVVTCPSYGGSCDSWSGPTNSNVIEHTFDERDVLRAAGAVEVEITNKLSGQGDRKSVLNYTVTDGQSRMPPKITSYRVTSNGRELNHPNQTYAFKLGDQVRFEIAATDPQGADIRYDVVTCPSYGGSCDSWSSASNSNVIEHTFDAKDVLRASGIVEIEIGNKLSNQGDRKWALNYTVTDGQSRLPPQINSVRVSRNGRLLKDLDKSYAFQIGDRVRFEIAATDPQGAEIRYEVVTCPSYGGSCDSWSGPTNSNVIEHTFDAKDVLRASGLVEIEIKNRSSSQDTRKTALRYTVTDHQSRLPPNIGQIRVEQEKLRPISKQEASDLKQYLLAQDSKSCAVIVASLDEFIQDQSRTQMEVLAWFTGTIDDGSKVCLNILKIGIKAIFTGK